LAPGLVSQIVRSVNEIEINAPCAAVWNHLVQAKQWPQWCSFSDKVKIRDGSLILQKDTKFTWSGLDLPQDDIAVFHTLARATGQPSD